MICGIDGCTQKARNENLMLIHKQSVHRPVVVTSFEDEEDESEYELPDGAALLTKELKELRTKRTASPYRFVPSSHMDELMKRVESAVRWHNRRLSGIRSEVRAVELDIETAQKKAAQLVNSVDNAQKDFESSVASLVEMQHDPLVRVRNYGAYRNRYHSDRAPCGRAGERFDRLFVGEAEERGARPCSFCGRKVYR